MYIYWKRSAIFTVNSVWIIHNQLKKIFLHTVLCLSCLIKVWQHRKKLCSVPVISVKDFNFSRGQILKYTREIYVFM